MGFTVYHAKAKRVSGDKTYWDHVGLTVFVTEENGETRVNIKDARTGGSYPCFEPKAWDGGGKAAPARPAPDEDMPF